MCYPGLLRRWEVGETQLSPGMCARFKAGNGAAHELANRSTKEVLYLEVGERTPGDSMFCPGDDMKAALGSDRTRCFEHKDGSPC